MAEEYRFGGTCVIRGCVPKKLFVYASQAPRAFRGCRGLSAGKSAKARSSWREADRSQGTRGDRQPAGRPSIRKGPKSNKATIFDTRAELVGLPYDPAFVKTGKTVTAEKIVIATGGALNPHGASNT